MCLCSELRTKELSETEDRSQLSYIQSKIFFYNESTSGEGLSDSDIICTINIPLIVRKLRLVLAIIITILIIVIIG